MPVGQVVRFPVAHHDGNYFADPQTLDRLAGDGRVVFRYCDARTDRSRQRPTRTAHSDNIAGIASADGRILGLMPHPERLADPLLGGTDGFQLMFRSAGRNPYGTPGWRGQHAIHV